MFEISRDEETSIVKACVDEATHMKAQVWYADSTRREAVEQATFSSCHETMAKDKVDSTKEKNVPREWMSVSEHALCLEP